MTAYNKPLPLLEHRLAFLSNYASSSFFSLRLGHYDIAVSQLMYWQIYVECFVQWSCKFTDFHFNLVLLTCVFLPPVRVLF